MGLRKLLGQRSSRFPSCFTYSNHPPTPNTQVPKLVHPLTPSTVPTWQALPGNKN